MNLASLVEINAKNLSSKPAIYFGEQSITYGQLWAAIQGIAASLHHNGVSPGDRIGLCMKDHAVHVMAHYAVARLSATIVPIDHRWTTNEKRAAAETFNTKLLITDDETVDGVTTLTLGENSQDPAQLPAMNHEPNADLLISLSSGTTGKPKGALVTHDQLYQRFISQWAAIGIDSNDCFAIVTPLFFGAGRSFAMCLLAVGGQIRIAPPPLKPPEIVQVLNDKRVTSTFLPPTLLRRLRSLESKAKPLLPSLKYLLVSGEPLHSDEAHICLEKISPNLVGYYASSEGGGISVLKSEDFAQYAHTVGMPTFRTEVQIVGDDDGELEENQTGRLRYRGPGVATRFVDSDGTEKTTGKQGWFYPGDLAERLPSGHLVLRGRDKDVIIRGGVNVYPAEIEATLMAHPQVSEAKVLGVADENRGERIVAFVAASDLATEGLTEHCKEHLAPYKVPTKFFVMDKLPKSDSGKIDQKALLSRLDPLT